MIVYAIFKRICWAFTHLCARVEVSGIENVPRGGPFILIANHQSWLDPLAIQSHLPDPLFTLTKSTQFGGRVMRRLLPRLCAIPVRRYRTDPQVVRVIFRLLAEGKGVGIYAEGERSWDGRLQPLRRGTVRVLLRAGVPVVPCGIEGSFDVWPRWGKGPRRERVAIRYGTPIEFGVHSDRAGREAALGPAIERIEGELRRLSGESELPLPTGIGEGART